MTQTEKVNSIIDKAEFRFEVIGERLLICSAKLANGFNIVASSSTLEVKNFSFKQAKETCIQRVKQQLFQYESYYLAKSRGDNN